MTPLVGHCLLAVFLAHVVTAKHSLHEVMSKTEHGLYFGGEEGPEYELVTPTSRDAEGQYLSHQLLNNDVLLHQRRQRRHTDNHDAEKTFLHFHAFGEDHHMNLKRNTRMFHDNFAINIHEEDGDMSTHTYATDCFHHGHLSSHKDSEIAMSNCEGGLLGIVRKKREIYHVHSLKSELVAHPSHNPDGHTHLVHRVREKREKDTGYDKNAEVMRDRSKRNVPDLPAVDVSAASCESNETMSGMEKLSEMMSVDMPDTIVLGEYQRRTAAREFGNNYVHAAIFIDHTLVEKYDGDEGFLIRYHFAMFNFINLIYQPSKTQYAVYIVLINLRILRVAQDGLYITQDSSRLLNNFCNWQQSINPRIGHPSRWNHAFLMTGYGLCFRQATDCGELGRAPIEGVCTADRECSVNREGGLNTAFVMAHELGHNLGMFHDGHPTEAASCPRDDGFLMKSSTSDAPRLWEFSPCSISHLRRYLRNEYSACMDKGDTGPTIDRNLQTSLKRECRIPPGQLYDRNEQCRLTFRHMKNRYYAGHAFKFCTRASYGPRDICKHLYCDNGRTDQGCWSTFTPALDGTVCGTNRVCWRYQCVPASRMYLTDNYCAPDTPRVNDVRPLPTQESPGATTPPPTTTPPPPPVPVDGSWSFFSAYSRCTATCGGGVRYRERSCTNPRPEHGGRPCVGESRMYQVCNPERCPNGIEYRQSTCQRFGTEWHESPIRSGEGACSLYCERRDIGGTVLQRHHTSSAVPNGVDCFTVPGTQQITGKCIRDRCVPIGCDNIINSTAVEDQCGVCRGRGESCKVFSGTLQGRSFIPQIVNGPVLFHVVPLRGTGNEIFSGSWDISLNFTNGDTSSLMVIRDNKPGANRTYYLHAPGSAIRSGRFFFRLAGALGEYQHFPNQPQRLRVRGSVDRAIVLEMIYFPDRLAPPNDISFFWKAPKLPPNEKFEWREVVGYGACSVTCGRGIQVRIVRCYNKQTDSSVIDSRCRRAGFAKPEQQRECMKMPCGASLVAFQPLGEPCDQALPCSDDVSTSTCVAIMPTTQGINASIPVAPRLCQRMQRMASVRDCEGMGLQVCRLPPYRGTCSETITSWYWHFAAGECFPFIYGGCGGNPGAENRFASKAECESHCREIRKCSLQVEAGPCPPHTTRWFHNVTSGACERFYYGGCGGNANRFVSLDECHSHCGTIACEPMRQYCHDDDEDQCAYYRHATHECPTDIMKICAKSCNACDLMTGMSTASEVERCENACPAA